MTNPFAIGSRWLAYADKKVMSGLYLIELQLPMSGSTFYVLLKYSSLESVGNMV
jgi:hypothetical protein